MKTGQESVGPTILIAESTTASAGKASVTIVVPCFNEEQALPYLHDRLASARKLLGRKYKIYLILVDDGSTDGTWQAMLKLFGDEPNCKLIRQPRNLGVATTIMTGIRSAKTEIVCSIDCDCTYDPHELEKLVPMLTSGVDLVTGSPYHPLGRVRGVPPWRLLLSKTGSRLYRSLLTQKIYTYTSCFRVYRRSVILQLDLTRNGFLGIAELITKLDFQNSVIVECPTTLEGRVRGTSKMKITHVLGGHLYLLCRLLALRGRQLLLDGRPAGTKPTNLEEGRGEITWA